MSYLDSHMDVTVGQTSGQSSAPVKTQTTSYQCLIVSASQSRREMLLEAATQGGWDTVVCSDSAQARSEITRTGFRLAIVDLEGFSGPTVDDFRAVCQQLISDGEQVLTAICGHEGDVKEEIWARQLGVWLYLPGVNEGDDLASLCGEARTIVKQIALSKEGVRQ